MGHLLPFYSLKNQKNQNFEKTKKLAKDIIILHKCTKNYNEVQFLRCRVRQTYFFCHFGPFFALYPPPPLTIWKIKTLKKKKEKSIQRCHHFTQCTKNHDHTMYVSWEMECDKHLVILGHFLHFYPNIDPKNGNLEKM